MRLQMSAALRESRYPRADMDRAGDTPFFDKMGTSRCLARLLQSLAHPSEGEWQLPQDELGLEPEHPVAHADELAIAPSIGRALALMTAAIDFDDEHGSRSDEVSDVMTEHHLTTKRHAQLPRAKGEPESAFWFGRVGSQQLGPLGEHELDFRIEGARAHGANLLCRPERPGFATLWRRRRDTPHPEPNRLHSAPPWTRTPSRVARLLRL